MLRNFQKLFSANILAGLLGLASLTIVSRALGAELFGVAAVTISIAVFIEQLAGFQAWQAVTRYAVDARVENAPEKFWKIVTIGIALDIVGCAMAALIGVMVVVVFAPLIGIPKDAQIIACIYMASLVFSVSGTPMAVLRIYERYNMISAILVGAATFKLAALACVLALGMTLEAALAIFALATAGQHLVMFVAFVRFAKSNGARFDVLRLQWRDLQDFPGFIRFSASVYLSTSLRNVTHELDTIVLSSAFGAAVAGQYRIAKQYGSVVFRAIEPAQQVIYPKVAEMVAGRDLSTLFSLIVRLVGVGVTASSVTLLAYWFVGDFAIALVLGNEFDLVFEFLGIFLFAVGIFSSFFFLRPLVLSLGKPDAILLIYALATALFFATYFSALGEMGPFAMMLAQIVFYAAWAVSMSLVAFTALRSVKAKSEPSTSAN